MKSSSTSPGCVITSYSIHYTKLYDSCLKNLQVIADSALENYEDIRKLTTGSAVAVAGKLAESRGGGQKWEVQADTVEIISLAPEDFPLQKKRHTDESYNFV